MGGSSALENWLKLSFKKIKESQTSIRNNVLIE